MRYTEHRRTFLEPLRNVDSEVLVWSARRCRWVKALRLVGSCVEDRPEVLGEIFARILLAMLEGNCDADLGRRGLSILRSKWK